jgi:hypothetical protein
MQPIGPLIGSIWSMVWFPLSDFDLSFTTTTPLDSVDGNYNGEQPPTLLF